MKNIYPLILLITLSFSFGCTSNCSDGVNRAEEIIAIEDVLEKYIIANENQNFDLIEKIWATDDDIVLYGTNSDEKLIGFTNIRNAIQDQFNKIENTYITASDQYIKINECGNTAWFAESLDYNFMYGETAHSYGDMRFTGVLVKVDGQWRFVQAHLSLPANINLSSKQK